MDNLNKNENFLEVKVPLKKDEKWAVFARGLRTRLKEACVPLRWQQFHHHMTILFLDDDHCVNELTQGFDRLVTPLSAFPITIDKLDAFTTGNGADHIVYMTATQVPSHITTLAQEARTLADGLNAPYDHRPFKPHITLGRVNTAKASLEQVRAVLQTIKVPAFECLLTEAEHRYRDYQKTRGKDLVIKNWKLDIL